MSNVVEEIVQGLVAQGLPPAAKETWQVAERIAHDYGTWEAYRYDLEVKGAQKHLTKDGRYRRPMSDDSRYRLSTDRRIAYHQGLDPVVNGRLLLELLEACWDGLTQEGRDDIAKSIENRCMLRLNHTERGV